MAPEGLFLPAGAITSERFPEEHQQQEQIAQTLPVSYQQHRNKKSHENLQKQKHLCPQLPLE